MTRSVFRYVRWRLVTVPPSPEVRAVCSSCGARSAAVDREDRTEAEEWAMDHTGHHPSHTAYKGVATSVWRMIPVDGTDEDVEPPEGSEESDGVLDDVCGALTYLPDEMLVSHQHITGRDLSNLVVLCAREPGHDPRDGHLGTVLDHGTHYWS
ncbi:hypothetical protein [Streptomyces uncialis]|uniref:DUF7848 domain-containing protein n=1 Tax=Streptomyces uncialis TaxID=1048205 RepID=UPI0038680245|nr:hypothetical protein OG268_31245 [Streptomyces uncialis]